MAARPILSFISMLLLAGAVLLQFFIVLSGTVLGLPENKVYFLQSSTDGIPGARNPSRWTYFAICGASSAGLNINCGAKVPALPFNPAGRSNFNTATGVPDAFIGTHFYFYMSRFAWAFYLVALFSAVLALFTSVLAVCTRLGAFLSSFCTFVALFWQALASALMTVWTVKGRNAFNSSGQTASLGKYAYGFSWAAVFALFVSAMLFCLGGASGRSSRHNEGTAGRSSRGGGLFGRKRSTRSRGSFIDSERSDRAKEDY